MTKSTTTHVLRSDRLCLRPCRADDLGSLHALWTEANVRRFLFDDRQISREEAQAFVDASEASFTDHGHGLWLFFEHGRDLVAGFAGLLPVPQAAPTLIFGTRPGLWGHGYAREAASAVLRYGFDVLGLDRVDADVDEPNEVSVRVLERLGMSRTRRAIVNGRPLLYYAAFPSRPMP
jgi:ribosomal-protein-alanine N-acetyltransferase